MDNILSKFVCLSLGAVIAAYFTRNLIDIALFALIFAACVSELYLFLLDKRHAPAKPDKNVEAARNLFVYSGDGFALRYLENALKTKYEVTPERGFLSVNGVALFSRIKPAPLDADTLVDMCSAAKSLKYKRAVILTNFYEPSAKLALTYISDIDVKLLEFKDVYRLLKCLKALPESNDAPEVKKSKREIFSELINRKRAGGYLMCALTLFLLSRFVGFSVYYIVAACAALVAGLVSLIRPAPDEK